MRETARWLAVVLWSTAAVGVHARADACGSCRGPGGAGSALTAPYQVWGASLTETMRLGHGIFDDRANYHAFGPESHDRVLELAGAVAHRPVSWLELGATAAYGHVLVAGPSFRSNQGALGDLALRVRWEVIEEPALNLTSVAQRPSVGLTLSTRLPTGAVDRSGDASAGPSPGTVGSTATSQGLGTTEVALAVDVRKTFGSRWQIGGVAEGALRAADESLGIDRALGPRGLLRVMGIAFVTDDFTVGLFGDLAAEGSVAYGGRTSPQSGQRAISCGASASLKTESGLRAGLATTFLPPIDGFGLNAVAATGLTTFLAFTR